MVDDRDIDKLIDELSETNRNLDRLVDAILNQGRGEQEEEGAEESIFPVDLVAQGKGSMNAKDKLEYERIRSRAANSPKVVRPSYTGPQEYVDLYVDLFRSNLENLQMISYALSQDDMDEFVRRIAVYQGADERLVNILEPGKGFFGIFQRGKDLQFQEVGSHLVLIEAMGYLWSGKDALKEPDSVPLPWNTLNVGSIEQRENINEIWSVNPEEFVRNDVATSSLDIDIKMIEAIQDSRGKEVPKEILREYNL